MSTIGRTAYTSRLRSRALVPTLCACALLAFSPARALPVAPGAAQHAFCKASPVVSTYSWLVDAPEFAVVTTAPISLPPRFSVPLLLAVPQMAAQHLSEFSHHIRPPPPLA